MNEYPESTKLAEVQPFSQKCGEFLEFLSSKDLHFGRWGDGTDFLIPVNPDISALLAAFFGIDLKALEAERQDMLEKLRSLQKEK